MKKTFKNIACSATILALFMLTSCSKDETQDSIKKQSSKDNISFEQFKKETGLKNFVTSININQNPSNLQARNPDGSYELSDFTVDTELIKSFVIEEKTTYTFLIHPKIITNSNIYNMTVFKVDNVWRTCILEMIPTEQNLIDLKNGSTNVFKGDINKIYDDSQNPFNPSGARVTIIVHCVGCQGVCDLCLSACVSIIVYPEPEWIGGQFEPGGGGVIVTPGDSGGSGSILTNSPYYIDPSGYVFTPNLSSFEDGVTSIRVQRAADFWNNLTDVVGGQQEWAINHSDDYNLILNDLLDDWSIPNHHFAVEMINTLINDGEVDIPNKIIYDPTFTTTKTDCVHKLLNSNSLNTYSKMLSTFNTSTNYNLTFKIGNVPVGDWGITSGNPNLSNNYEITISTNIENGSNLMKTITLCHELIHAYMFNTLENLGYITFDSNGEPHLSVSCLPNVNYNNVSINSLLLEYRFEALICAMNQNGTLTPNWSHQIFNSTNFSVATYRQEIENLIYNEHDWNNEDTNFKNQAISVFGNNWKHEIAKAVSWIGLDRTAEYSTYRNSYLVDYSKFQYIVDIKNKISTAKSICP